jgi:hypothetical protein
MSLPPFVFLVEVELCTAGTYAFVATNAVRPNVSSPQMLI